MKFCSGIKVELSEIFFDFLTISLRGGIEITANQEDCIRRTSRGEHKVELSIHV